MFSWYKYLIVSLVFSHLGFWSGNLFLIAPFPDLCLLVPLNKQAYHVLFFNAMISKFSRLTFKTYLGMGSPQKYHIKWYMPKRLSYPEVSEITRLKCPISVRAEKSKMASKIAAFKNY